MNSALYGANQWRFYPFYLQTKSQVDAITSDKAGYLKDFADRVFAVAESEYQNGQATKNTYKSFVHASVFLEALKQFGPLSDELLGRIRYAKWKGAEILKAIMEGRTPGPDGMSEKLLDQEMNGGSALSGPDSIPEVPAFGSMSYAASPLPQATAPKATVIAPVAPASSAPRPASTLSDSSDLDLPDVPVFSQSQLSSQRATSTTQTPNRTNGTTPSSAPTQPGPSQNIAHHATAGIGGASGSTAAGTGPRVPQDVISTPAPKVSSGFNNFLQSPAVAPTHNAAGNIDVILEATKYSKNAISALQFDDPQTAIKHLRAALRVLTGSDE